MKALIAKLEHDVGSWNQDYLDDPTDENYQGLLDAEKILNCERERVMESKIWKMSVVGKFDLGVEKSVNVLIVNYPVNSEVGKQEVIDWLSENTYYTPNSNVGFGSWYLSSVKVVYMDDVYGYAFVEAKAMLNV